MSRDDVLERERQKRKRHEDEQGEWNRLRLTHSSPPPGRPRDHERAGEGEEGVPPDALPDVIPGDVAELVREHEADLVVAETPVEERVPENDPLARPQAGSLRVGGGRVAADDLNPDGRSVLEALLAGEALRVAEQNRVSQLAL